MHLTYNDRCTGIWLKYGSYVGCVKRASAARGGQDAGITLPRDHSLADHCSNVIPVLWPVVPTDDSYQIRGIS